MEDLWYMTQRLLHPKSMFLLSLSATFIRCLFALWMPRLVADAVDAAVMLADARVVAYVGVRMLVACMGMGVFGYIANICCAVIGQRFSLRLREEAYDKIQDLSVAETQEVGYGSLITRLTTDIDVCSGLVQSMVTLLVEPVTLAVGGVVMMWLTARALGAIFVVFVVVQLTLMAFFVRATAPGFMRVRRMTDAFNRRLEHALAGFRLAKTSTTESLEVSRVTTDAEALFASGLAVRRVIAFFNPLLMLVMNLAMASIMMIAGGLIAADGMRVGSVLSAINYAEQVLLSIAAIGNVYRVLTETKPSAARVREVLMLTPKMRDGSKVWDGGFSELRFEDVRFSYQGAAPVIDGLSLTIRSGETVAMIGGVGSGKTTVAWLANRLVDVTSGRVFLNDADVRDYRMVDVRRAVALVEKQTAVMEDSVAGNVSFGREGVSADDIDEAIKVAQLEDYVAQQPQGLLTPLRSMGRTLSGGERQRLTIARALAGHPGLLVLDDCTSALDYLTEARLLESLRSRYPEMAVLLITNRLASARRADRIVVLKEGMIAGEGTDSDLRQGCEGYQAICDTLEELV